MLVNLLTRSKLTDWVDELFEGRNVIILIQVKIIFLNRIVERWRTTWNILYQAVQLAHFRIVLIILLGNCRG